VDHFVLADTFRYRAQSFQNRSKLRNAPGAHWITIPLFGHPQGLPFRDVEIETGGRWREKHWRSFLYDYRSTMYFDFFEESFRPFFEREWTVLADCTCRSVELQADLFGLDTTITRASALDDAPDTWAGIVEAVGAQTVVVPDAGDRPAGADVEVEAFAYDHPAYRQNFTGFERGMTGLDLLFNYGREALRILAGGVGAPAGPQ
jgi:hypothetical protein